VCTPVVFRVPVGHRASAGTARPHPFSIFRISVFRFRFNQQRKCWTDIRFIPWFQMFDDGTDNQLRNAIAHVKTDYDEVNQIITYYPRLEGMNQEKAEQITFIQFMKRLLQTYREMRRLNHLIKGLFYLQYLVIDRDKPATATSKG
jgi:hypothetical protein